MDAKLAYRLLELRREHGYTQERLAELLGADIKTVSLWEQAEAIPNNVMLRRLSEVYGVPAGELLPPTADEPPPTKPAADQTSPGNHPPEPARSAALSKSMRRRLGASYPILVLVLFLLCGNVLHMWNTAFLMFFSIPLLYILLGAYGDGQYTSAEVGRRFLTAAYPILVVSVFLSLGVMFDIWDPTWLLFLTIPLFYILRGAYRDGRYTSEQVARRFLTAAYPLLVTTVFLSLGSVFGVWDPTWILFLTIPLFYILRGKMSHKDHE